MAAQIAPALREQQSLGVVRRSGRRVAAQHIARALNAVLVVVADAAALQRGGHAGVGLAHAGRREDPFGKGVAQRDAHILDTVMVVDEGVPLADDGQVKPAVRGEEREHVVKEADAGADVAFARSVELKGQSNIGFGGSAPDFCVSHDDVSCLSFSRGCPARRAAAPPSPPASRW